MNQFTTLLLLLLPVIAYTQDDPPLMFQVPEPSLNLNSAEQHGPDSPEPDDDLRHLMVRNGKYGVVEHKNKIIVPCIYDDIDGIPSDKMVVRRNKHMALINHKNEQLIPFQYKYLQLSKNTPFVFATPDKGKMRILDTLGKIVVPVSFNDIRDFDGQRLMGVVGNAYFEKKKIYLYDATGKLEQELPYSWLKPIGDGRYIASKDSLIRSEYKTMLGIVDRNGKVLFPFNYTYFDWIKGNWARAVDHINHVGGLLRFSDGYFQPLPDETGLVRMDDLDNLMISKGSWENSTVRYGVSDTLLHEIYPPVYHNVQQLRGGDYYLVNKLDKYAIGDRHGKLLTDFIYGTSGDYVLQNTPPHWDGYHISYPGNDTLPLRVIRNYSSTLYGLFDHQRGWLVPDTCEKIAMVSRETYIIQSHTRRNYRYECRMYDIHQKALTPVYEEMRPFFNQTAFAKSENKVVMLDKVGQVMKTIDSDILPRQFSGNNTPLYFEIEKNGKRALCGVDFQAITPFKYKSIGPDIPYECGKINKNIPGYGKWVAVGFIDDNNRVAIDEKGKEFLIKR